MTFQELNQILAAIPDSEIAAKGRELISQLCKSGGRAWSLRVPPDPKNDPDLIFGELCRRVEALAKAK